MPPKGLDYTVLEKFLTGELSLNEIAALRTINHASRALIVMAVVMSRPDLYLRKPHKDAVLSRPLKGLGDTLFPRSTGKYAAGGDIVAAARRHGLHSVGAIRNTVKLNVPEEVRVLLSEHPNSQALKDAVEELEERKSLEECWESTRREREAAEAEASANKIVSAVQHLESVLSTNEVGHVVHLLRQRMGWRDRHIDPARDYGFGNKATRDLIKQLARKRLSRPGSDIF